MCLTSVFSASFCVMAAAVLVGCGGSSSSTLEVSMSDLEGANVHATSYLAEDVFLSDIDGTFTGIEGTTPGGEPSVLISIDICDALAPGLFLPTSVDPTRECHERDIGGVPYAVVLYEEIEGTLDRSWISVGGSVTVDEVTDERVVIHFEAKMDVRDLLATENAASGTFTLTGKAVAYEEDRQQK